MSVAAPKKGAYKRRTICFYYELFIIYADIRMGSLCLHKPEFNTYYR